MSFLVPIFLVFAVFFLPIYVVAILSLLSVFIFKMNPFVFVVPFFVFDMVFGVESDNLFGIHFALTIISFTIALLLKILTPKIIWLLDS